MSENRIHDWIRYVQENSENVADKSAQETSPRDQKSRDETLSRDEKPPRASSELESRDQVSNRETTPRETLMRETTPRETSVALRSENEAANATEAANAIEESSTRIARRSPQTSQRVRLKAETRAQMLERLTNPTISLHETSVILDVCPATVRRYCELQLLPDLRTAGNQRRFRLREVLALARAIESKKRKRH